MLAGSGLVWWQREYLRDQWILRSYEPEATITQLADDTGMTTYGQRLFLVNKPQLNDKDSFNKNCEGKTDEVAVLGCYRGNRLGIYIYNVTDPRLAGVEQVTAAHEMLHQAYDRLNDDQRQHIDGLLEDYYQHKLTSQSVKDKIKIYQETAPNDLHNEMHSIFGTEVADLPQELEAHYQRYFADRARVLSFYGDSQAEFDKYHQQIADFDARLAALKPQIEAAEADLTSRSDQIKTQKTQLDQLLAAGDVKAYNAAVPDYNQLIEIYRQKMTAAKSLIDTYNQIVGQRNATAVQVKTLNEALDSRLAPH